MSYSVVEADVKSVSNMTVLSNNGALHASAQKKAMIAAEVSGE